MRTVLKPSQGKEEDSERERILNEAEKNKTNVVTRCEEADFGGLGATERETIGYIVGMTGEI